MQGGTLNLGNSSAYLGFFGVSASRRKSVSTGVPYLSKIFCLCWEKKSASFWMASMLRFFLGGCDGLLIALVVFASVDYITGVMCAVSDRALARS